MPYVNALRGAVRLAQKRDFARDVFAGWQHFVGSFNGRLDALVARYRLNTADWLPLGPLRMARDRLAGLLDRVLDRPVGNTPPAAVRVEEAPLMDDEWEWALVTGPVHAAAELAQSAGILHRAAALQVDAAVYALDDLISELRQVMDLGKHKIDVLPPQTGRAREAATSLSAIAVRAAVSDVAQSRQKIQNAA